MEPEDLGDILKILIILAAKFKTGMDFFYGLPFFDTLEIMKEAAELGKEQRVQNGNKNCR